MADVVKRIYTREQLENLIFDTHKTAKDHGWWTKDERGKLAIDLEEKLVLVLSELAEAFEEYRKPDVEVSQIYFESEGKKLPWTALSKVLPLPKPEGFPVELADAYIRLLDLAGAADYGTTEARVLNDVQISIGGGPERSVGWHIHKIAWRVIGIHDLEEVTSFAMALAAIEGAALELRVDLRSAIEWKMKYNEGRPYRHGNKRA